MKFNAWKHFIFETCTCMHLFMFIFTFKFISVLHFTVDFHAEVFLNLFHELATGLRVIDFDGFCNVSSFQIPRQIHRVCGFVA